MFCYSLNSVSSEDFLLPICLGPFHGKTFPECLVILGCASLVDAISGRLKDPPCWLDLTQWQIFLSFFSFSKCFVFFLIIKYWKFYKNVKWLRFFSFFSPSKVLNINGSFLKGNLVDISSLFWCSSLRCAGLLFGVALL